MPIHLSGFELSLLERRADRLGLPVHSIARCLVVQGRVAAPPVPKVNYSAVGQLGRTANLLRQALRQVRSGRLAADLQPLLERCLEAVAELRHALVTPSA